MYLSRLCCHLYRVPRPTRILRVIVATILWLITPERSGFINSLAAELLRAIFELLAFFGSQHTLEMYAGLALARYCSPLLLRHRPLRFPSVRTLVPTSLYRPWTRTICETRAFRAGLQVLVVVRSMSTRLIKGLILRSVISIRPSFP